MDPNLAQELANVDQEPLLLVFLDPRKYYDMVCHGRLIRTLEGYGEVPKMYKLLATLWDHQEVFKRQNRYHGPKFKATWEETQGGMF